MVEKVNNYLPLRVTNEMFRVITTFNEIWLVCDFLKGSHLKIRHPEKPGIIVFPNHGSRELGKGLEKKIRKDAGLKK